MAKRARRRRIVGKPGLSPGDDISPQGHAQYVDSNMVRWKNGLPQPVPPTQVLTLSTDGYQFDVTNNTLGGNPITWIYSYYDIANARTVTLVGTSRRLYAIYNLVTEGAAPSVVRNITPVVTSTTTIAASLDTYYKTLANNPVATVITSKTITVTDASTKVKAGDSITLSGCSGNPGGIPNAEINTTHTVVSAAANSFTVTVATTAATSSTSGGGASVVLATPIITVNASAHGMLNGDRVKLTSAATTGGIPDTEINAEHIIRNKGTNAFDIKLTTKATSSVTGGGGASTAYQAQIAAGTYGSAVTTDRFWSGALFGTVPIIAPGNGNKLYEWAGSIAVAPTVVTNSPSNVDFCFITDNIIVTFYQNIAAWSDQGTRTTWTSTAANQAGGDTIEGAGQFIGVGQANGENLVYTKSQVWLHRYIGLPYVFSMKLLYAADGLAGRKAVRDLNGVLMWIGQANYYRWYGGSVEIVPSNTMYNYTFHGDVVSGDVDWNGDAAQRHLTVAFATPEHKEVLFVPTGENSLSAIVYSGEGGWFGRHDAFMSAGGEGGTLPYPIFGTPSGKLYFSEYEDGATDYFENAYNWTYTTNYGRIGEGDNTFAINAFYPDSAVLASVTINTKLEAQDASPRSFALSSVTSSKVDARAHGRLRQYVVASTTYYPTSVGIQYEDVIELGGR